MLEIPPFENVDLRLVLFVLAVVQLPAHVIVEGTDIGRTDRRGLRIVIGFLAERIHCGPRKPRVEAPCRHIRRILQRLFEFAAIDAQIRLLDVPVGQACELVKFRGDCVALGLRKR